VSNRTPRDRLLGKADRGFQGYPLATFAWYGPDASRASKLALGIIRKDNGEVVAMEKWYSTTGDMRYDHDIGVAVLAFIQKLGVRSVVTTDRILGCPHEEGKDYPLGGVCPECPYWAGRPRPI
jgi:hypothetical protein